MYCIERHGPSGRWYAYINVEDILEATAIGQRLKNDGYGVRIWEATKLITNAPDQAPFALGDTTGLKRGKNGLY